jgi:tetratricopeptide (TPR) repeat protein
MTAVDPAHETTIHLVKQRNFLEADRIANQVLESTRIAPPDNKTAIFLHDLGREYFQADRHDTAMTLVTRASEIHTVLHGIESASLASDLSLLGTIHETQGRFSEAEASYTRCFDIRERALGGDHPETVRASFQLGTLYQLLGRPEEALHALRRARKILGKTIPADAWVVALFQQLAESSREKGESAEQITYLKEALCACKRLHRKPHLATAVATEALGHAYWLQRKRNRAETCYRQAQVLYRKTVGSNHPRAASVQRSLQAMHTTRRREPFTLSALIRPGYIIYAFFRHWSRRQTYALIVLMVIVAGLFVWQRDAVLESAVENQRPVVARIALLIGADPGRENVLPLRARKLLHLAVTNPDASPEILERLLDHGMDCHGTFSDGTTILWPAVKQGREGIVSVLLAKGVDVNHLDSSGKTVLWPAVKEGKAGVVAMLIEKKSNV